MIDNNYKSQCHEVVVRYIQVGESTRYYTCTTCNRPCIVIAAQKGIEKQDVLDVLHGFLHQPEECTRLCEKRKNDGFLCWHEQEDTVVRKAIQEIKKL